MVKIRVENTIKRPDLVLVADDDKFMRSILRDILKKDGYEIVEACDGLETLVAFERNQPDLILLDVVMPMIDGCSVCAKIRELATGKQVPILMLTAQDDEDTINHAFGVGADDYINKNINPTVFRNRIKRLLEAEYDRKIVAHLAWMEQLNVIGAMAASIGHEVRNPMTTVRGFLQYLGQKNDLENYKGHFNLMIDELDRANSIITEFLSLAKNKAMDFKRIKLNELITEFYPVFQPAALLNRCNIEIDIEEVPAVWIDKPSIRQLILNMVRNAIEAMTEGGTIKIGLRNREGKVVMFIEDQGIGIPIDFMDKLGTPFLTSKEAGLGLGPGNLLPNCAAS